MLPNASACSVCQGHDHLTKKCPELTKEINQTGFYKPAGGMPQGGDDDDEHMRGLNIPYQSYFRNKDGFGSRVPGLLSELRSRSDVCL